MSDIELCGFKTGFDHRDAGSEYYRSDEHDYRYLTGVNRTRFLQRRLEFEGLVFRLVDEAIEQGTFRKSDVRLLVFQFFNLHKGTIQWYQRDGGWTAGELSREYCRTLFNGFASTAGSFEQVEERVDRLRAMKARSEG